MPAIWLAPLKGEDLVEIGARNRENPEKSISILSGVAMNFEVLSAIVSSIQGHVSAGADDFGRLENFPFSTHPTTAESPTLLTAVPIPRRTATRTDTRRPNLADVIHGAYPA